MDESKMFGIQSINGRNSYFDIHDNETAQMSMSVLCDTHGSHKAFDQFT